MRRPIDQRSLSLLMKRPSAMSRFLATGALPSVAKPSSPLITLLESLSPRERSRIVGLKVGPALGYNGSRQFHTAHQALSWLIPANLSTMPASQSWQDRRFTRRLTIGDLQACANVPADIVRTWWQRHPGLQQDEHTHQSQDNSPPPLAPEPS